MGPVRHKIVTGILFKFGFQTLSASLNYLLTIQAKNKFLFNYAPGFKLLSFEFNFLFIKSSASEIPVLLLCGEILHLNKNAVSFSFKLADSSIFLKVFLKVPASLSAHPFVAG